MRDINIVIADQVSAVMRNEGGKRVDFNTAFSQVTANYRNLDLAEIKSTVGSILGKRRKRKRKILPNQMELFGTVSRREHIEYAEAHEQALTAGIPEHDR